MLLRSCRLIVLAALRAAFLAIVAGTPAAAAPTRVQPIPVPDEMRTSAYSITVDGKPVDVAHAAASLEFASFDANGPVNVEITASEPGFWDHGATIEPWRLGLRAERKGQTIRFRLEGPAKLSIGRPRDFLNHAHLLFLFAGEIPPPAPRGAAVKSFAAGVYKQSLTPKSGETFYLAPGSVFLGSLNLADVHDVKILGRGVMLYDGPQDPNNDEGWMQRPDWHCIGAYNAQNVEVHGLTCVVRSRTWSIQMKDTSGFVYDDLRVMGGNPGNANQDGMDWLGGGDAVVRNSFLRASDDVFAMQGNWDGYLHADMVRPGHNVANIRIENSQVSTSISNIVRAGWPQKNYNSSHFSMRNIDVLHAGIGACGQSFGLIGFWGAQGARGSHTDYSFENIFLDNWYSLLQLEQEKPGLKGFVFRNVYALDQPPLAASTLVGDVSGVVLDNVKIGQQRVSNQADLPLLVASGTQAPIYDTSYTPEASFRVDPPTVKPGETATFTALLQRNAHYTWLFGDGTEAYGQRVEHRYPDALGSDLDGHDGAGRFRVLLKVETRGAKPAEDWAADSMVVVNRWQEAAKSAVAAVPGLTWKIYPGTWTELPDLEKEVAIFTGVSTNLHANSGGYTRYAVSWDGWIDAPVDGGYSFHLLDRDGARLMIDGIELARTGAPFGQVCGAVGNAMRYDRGSLGLHAGRHSLHIEGLFSMSNEAPRLLWEGPGLKLADVPAAAFSHERMVSVTAAHERPE